MGCVGSGGGTWNAGWGLGLGLSGHRPRQQAAPSAVAAAGYGEDRPGARTVGTRHHDSLDIRPGVRLAQVVEQAVQHCMTKRFVSVSERR